MRLSIPDTPVAVAPHVSRAAGRAELAVARDARDATVVTRAYATSPLRLLLPANHGHAAWVYTSSFGGGLVDGDRVSMAVDVQPDASLFLSTQASTKVYRSPRGTEADVHARVGRSALLVLAPDPVVCFEGASYRQRQEVHLSEDAGLVLVDWLTSGRHASGERWAFDDYTARLSVRRGGRLLVHDSVALRRAHGDLVGRMGRFDVMGLALVIGPALRDTVARIQQLLAEEPSRSRPDDLLAVAPVGLDGCIVRFAGTSSERLAARLRTLLADVPRLLGDDPWARKW